jgi:hypothetical protein
MMKDIIGLKFGRLTVKSLVEKTKKYGKNWEIYLCVCECGNEKIISRNSLFSKAVNSCGCLQRDAVREIGIRNQKHGKTPKKLYRVWEGMHERCRDIKHISYPRYGGRGITVCPEWKDYTVFRDWSLKNGDKEGVSIDRIDNNRNYEPSNCRWVELSIQSHNKRSNRYININGETLTYSEWEKKLGLTRGIINSRISAGWTEEEAVLGRKTDLAGTKIA